MNATLDINVSIRIDRQLDAVRFRPTTTRISNFHFTTDLDSYAGVLSTAATSVFAEIQSIRQAGDIPTATHVYIKMGNPTHPTPATGVVPLAKAGYDLVLDNNNWVNAQSLVTQVTNAIKSMKTEAQY